jgi:hypothetical protein
VNVVAHVHPIYDVDKSLIIDVNTKNVKMDKGTHPAIAQYDHNSEYITFECDRFVEGHDLSLCDKVEIHYINQAAVGRYSSRGVYEAVDLQVSNKDQSKVVFSWLISQKATTYAGFLSFVVSFSCNDEGDLTYRWNTNVCNELKVGESYDYGEAVTQAYADVLEMWKRDLFGIEDTAESRMQLYMQQQQDAMEVKAREIMETMPDEYMEYSDFEKSKANVADINRFFDSDWVTGNRENLYPHGDSSYTYSGESSYSGVSAGDVFYLEEGLYDFIVTDTNAVGIYVMLGDFSYRLLSITDYHIGVHDLYVSSDHAGKPLVVQYYASGATPNEAGEYYLKRPYIFKRSDRGILSNDFFIKSPIKLLESDVIKCQKGDNLYTGGDIEFYHDGVNTFIGKQGMPFTLEEGDYTLTVLDSNAIMFILYLGEPGSNSKRIVSTNKIPIGFKFTITSEYANQPLTFYVNASMSTPTPAGDFYARSIYIFKDDGVSLLPEYFIKDILENSVLNKISGPAFKAQNGALSISSDVLSADDPMVIDAACDVKINKSLVFTGDIFTIAGSEFGSLYVGHGKTAYGGTYVEIDKTNINVYNYESGPSLKGTIEHGLTISYFLTVIINVGFTKADITISTSTGSFTYSDAPWMGCNGEIFAESHGQAFTNCELRWVSSDIKHPVWVFGDSYLGFNDNRWAGQMHNLGYKNWLACGFAGAGSARELETFKTLLILGTPDIAVWCMGMNNGDSGAISNSWLSATEEFLSLCEANDITPVLATIPTCPNIDNTYKNEWVRNSGYRYVDFNKAVGVTGTTWYNGMLSADKVHPTELGAKALVSRVCVDVPEIMK